MLGLLDVGAAPVEKSSRPASPEVLEALGLM
jgi:hypothetical protein